MKNILSSSFALAFATCALTGCSFSPHVTDLTATHPDRSKILGRFHTTRKLYGYWQKDSGRIFLGTSVTTPWSTDENGVFGPQPQEPDHIFPIGSIVEVDIIKKYVQKGFPEHILVTGTIRKPGGSIYPMEEIHEFTGRKSLQGPSWRR